MFDNSQDAEELIVFKMVDICFASFVVVENDFESVASRHSRHETQIALVDIGDGAGTRACVDFPSAISSENLHVIPRPILKFERNYFKAFFSLQFLLCIYTS